MMLVFSSFLSANEVVELGDLRLTGDELEFLKKACPYLPAAYIAYLEKFYFRPAEQLKLTFTPAGETSVQIGTEREERELGADKLELVCCAGSIR